MIGRDREDDSPGRETGAVSAGEGTRDRDLDRGRGPVGGVGDQDRGRGPVGGVGRDRDEERGRGPVGGFGPSRDAAREEFGGVNWGAAFFGWLVAIGMSAILIALLSALGAAVGAGQNVTAGQAQSQAGGAGLVGAILLLLVLMVAYYCGGYVAGRMSRFDGGRQGAMVWVFGLIVTIILAVAGALLGARFNVLQQVSLPGLPLNKDTLATGGLITLLAVILGTLLAAFTGGKAGRRYHTKVDRLARA
jgi:hypothetical protein